MADTREIEWLAGLLEGEGCFTTKLKRPTPSIQLAMTDMDVVIKAAKLLGCYSVIRARHRTKGDKSIYRAVITGRRAVGWCMTLYGLMGERRQARIKEVLAKWKASPHRTYSHKGGRPRVGTDMVWQRSTENLQPSQTMFP